MPRQCQTRRAVWPYQQNCNSTCMRTRAGGNPKWAECHTSTQCCWPAPAPGRSQCIAAVAGKYEQAGDAAAAAAMALQQPRTACSLTRVDHAPNMTATAVFHRLRDLRQHAPQLLQCRRIRHASGMQGYCKCNVVYVEADIGIGWCLTAPHLNLGRASISM
jgi:hypothetical protein